MKQSFWKPVMAAGNACLNDQFLEYTWSILLLFKASYKSKYITATILGRNSDIFRNLLIFIFAVASEEISEM
jgi:hypothetical protein